ncbi:hypothetical protein ACFW6E_45930 [Streptomyces olivaceoviridis]|uniref:hypothetical protein n=1 Tax=Streptomyces olivaceoviridis TaxID=1921 RepID=UPI0036AF895C
MWKLTRPDNRHDKLTRDNLLDLQDHHLVRIELVREDQRQVWVLTKRGHGEAKKLLEPKGIRVSSLREEKYDLVTGELLGASYDDHSAAVTSTAAELHRVGIGHRFGFATEVPHRLGNGYGQRADLVVRAPEAGVPVLLLEIDRRTEDAHDLVAKLRRYWEWGRLLEPDAHRLTVDLVRSRPDAIEDVGHDKRLWRRVYPPTGREGLVPLAFVFADTTAAKVDNTVKVIEEAGRRYWAPRRYETYYQEAITAKDYSQAVPVVVTTLEQLQEHGADAAVWRRLGRKGEQSLTDALDNPDGDALYRRQYARAEAEDEGRRAAERERGGRCASGVGGSSPTSAGRRPPRERPGRPGTCRCAAPATPTTSPARRPPLKPPASRPPRRRRRRTTPSRGGAAAGSAGDPDPARHGPRGGSASSVARPAPPDRVLRARAPAGTSDRSGGTMPRSCCTPEP